MPNPTIVSASLDDKELQQSIANLVAHVKRGLHTMLTDTNSTVDAMEKKLKSLGNIKIDSVGSVNGSASKKATEQQKDLEAQTKKTTQAAKEQAMSFDQIVQGLKQAMGVVSNFNTLRQHIDPSKQDYAEYERALARIVEYNDKLKQSALSRADANQWANVFDAKATIRDLTAVDDRYKKLVRWYTVLEKEDQRRIARDDKDTQKRIANAEKERAAREKMIESARKAEQKYQDATLKSAFRGALTLPTNNIDELRYKIERITTLTSTLRKEGLIDEAQVNRANAAVAKLNEQLNKQLSTEKEVKSVQSQQTQPQVKSARDSYIAFMQGYKQQAEQVRRLMDEEQKAMQQRRHGVVDGFTKTIEERKARVKELSEEIAKLYKERPDGYRDAIKQRTEEMNALKQKIRELSEAQKNLAEFPIGASNRYLELEKEYNRIKNIMIDTTNVQRQSSQESEKQTQSAQRYTEEIRRQAAAIRSSKEWQEKGWIVIGDNRFFDPERANVSKRDKQMLLSLEEQILQKENERIAAQERQNRESQREVEIKSQLPKQGYLFTNEDVISNKVNNARAERYKQLQEEEKYVNSRNAAIAKALHIGQEEIKSYDVRTASAKELNAMLKQQQDAYSRLSTAQRSQNGGTELLSSIQNTQRALQKLQLQMSRPVNLKAALAGSEVTLDEVAYKIRRLQAYMQGLDATNERSAAEIKKVAFNIELLKQKQNDLLNKNSQLIGSNNSLIKSNTALGRSWNYMKNRLAFYFTVGASTQFVKNLIEIRSQYEMTERALGILVNSAERGTQIFNELSQMALVSPYTLIELSGAAKQLVAYDVAAKDVVDTTRRLADMASAVGVPMERLTYALGQIKAYGYLNSRDNRMFANAGIPLVKQLADYYTELEGKLVSTADVYDRIKKKAVGYADVMQVITKMTDEGGKFFDFQEKMSGTLKVQIANLTLAWNNMLNEIGASEQGILTAGIAGLKNLFLAWKDLSNILTTIAAIFGIVKAQQILSNIAIGKSTVSLIGYINANKEATWVEYSRALQTKKLTATQAAWLLMTNKNNAALAASLVRLKIIDAATARYLTTMKGLSAGLLQLRIMGTMALNGLAKGVKALGAAFMTNLPLVALTAAIDLFTHFSSVASNNKSFNESIATGANEASEALRNFMKEEDKVQARAKAASGNLSDTEAKKVWEAIREQIELSSQAANIFIPQLLSITNINERVTAAFNLADKIQEATNKLGELRDEMEVSQDSWFWGLFGEGIGEDLDDYNKRVKELHEQAKYFAEGEKSVWEDLKIAINGVWDGIGGGSGSQGAKEAVREIEKFANNAADVIKEKLGKEGVLDEKQVTEAVARFVKAAEQQIPEIRGAGKKLFEALTNDIMGKQFEVFNAQEYYYSAFLEQLKKDYGSKFADITEDIKDKTVVWSDAQKKAIKETADKVKKDWPQASRDAIDEILKDLNNTEFKLHLIAAFSTELTDFQQQFNTRANKLGTIIADTLQRFSPQSGDDLPAWTKKQQESIKALREENKNYEKDNSEWAKQRIAANNTEIEGRTKALSLFKQSAISDKDAAKNKKQAESELAKALKEELSTIDKVRSIYKDLTKEGMSHANAVERATRGWDETVNAINKVLTKNGLQKLDLSKFAGIENPRELVNMLQSQLNTLLKRGAKPAEIKELQTKVNTWKVDADKYDLTMITKGLNNELGKLKDEYELAVELDADPELGGMFADMFGIDTSTMSHSIDEYMDNVRMAVDKARMGLGYGIGIDIFGASEDEWQRWAEWVGISNEKMQEFRAMFEPARSVVKKWATDTVNNTKKLEYELAELNDKIAIKEKEQALLHEKIEKEKNETTKHYLELTYQSNEKAIDELRAQALSLMPEYARVFNSIAEYSAGVSRRLQRDLMRVFDEAKYDSASGKWTLTGSDGKQTILNDTQYRKEREKLTKEMRKSQSPFKKIKEAFKPSDKNGVVDYAKGIELISGEVQKLGSVASEVGNLAQIFGADEQTVEIINDVATSLNGVATAGQGISQIASGDYIGGAASVLSGITSVIGAWVDNSDKKISDEIKESELAVKRLENAYKSLSLAIENSYGTQAIGMQMTEASMKKLELAELKRQLRLEKSRDSKHKDEQRIADLQGQIIDLENEIQKTMDNITNSFLGISSVGDAVENMIAGVIESLRNGEDAMSGFNESVDEMIANMLKKFLATKILAPMFENVWNEINDEIQRRTKNEADALAKAQAETVRTKGLDYGDYYGWIRPNLYDNSSGVYEWVKRYLKEEGIDIRQAAELSRLGDESAKQALENFVNWVMTKEKEDAEKATKQAQKELDKASMPTEGDLMDFANNARELSPQMEEYIEYIKQLMERLGLMKSGDEKTLSNLQQGIQGITEDTAGALEAYMNGVSQQVYYQSDLLTQIRDAVVGIDVDVQVATQAQMLLQLQQSYSVQMAIQGILEGVLVPSGRAFSVELLS